MSLYVHILYDGKHFIFKYITGPTSIKYEYIDVYLNKSPIYNKSCISYTEDVSDLPNTVLALHIEKPY
jgi:hypothetical protein